MLFDSLFSGASLQESFIRKTLEDTELEKYKNCFFVTTCVLCETSFFYIDGPEEEHLLWLESEPDFAVSVEDYQKFIEDRTFGLQFVKLTHFGKRRCVCKACRDLLVKDVDPFLVEVGQE